MSKTKKAMDDYFKQRLAESYKLVNQHLENAETSWQAAEHPIEEVIGKAVH